MSDQNWRLLYMHKGCAIMYRVGLQRRGFMSVYRNCYREDKQIGCFIHDNEKNAREHIDKLHKDLGSAITITQYELKQFIGW